jgi:hypothetical protein
MIVDLLEYIDELEVLKKYIPSKLFAETSLPEVCIRAGRKRYEHEDVENVIASCVPGRVTFRWDRSGNIIPLRTDNVYGVYVDITNRISGGNLEGTEGVVDQIPDEWRHYIHKRTKIVRPSTINVYRYSNNKEEIIWRIRIGHPLEMHRIESIKKKVFIVDKSTTAYPIVKNVPIGALPSEEHEINEYSPFVKFTNLSERNVLRFVYSVVFRGVTRVVESPPSYLPKLNEVSERAKARVDVTHVGIPASVGVSGGTPEPLLYGYYIKNTNILKINLPEHVEKFINEFLEKVENCLQAEDSSSISLKQHFIRILFNDILYNISLNVLINNPSLINKLRNPYFSDILEYYLTFSQIFLLLKLFNGGNLEELLQNFKCEIGQAISDSISLDSKGAKGDKAFLLKFVKGLLKIPLRRIVRENDTIKANDVVNYCDSILEKCINRANIKRILKFVILHTISHGLIRNSLIEVGGVGGHLLQEGGLRSPWEYSRPGFEAYIFELSDGGLGVVKSFMENAERDPQGALYSFIRAFGHCIIGVPEDLIYYAFLKAKALREKSSFERDFEKYLDQAIDELGVLVLREEREEAKKLFFNIAQEHGGKGLEYLMEVLDARFDFENEFLRTPTPEELTLYIMQRIDRLSSVKEYLIKALKAYCERPSFKQQFDDIKREYIIFRQVSENDWVESFLNDISNLLKLNKESEILIKFIYNARNKDEKEERRELVRRLAEEISNIILSSFSRYFLLTCNSACGWCYVNTRSCEEVQDPLLQVHTLNRKLLNLYVAWIIRRLAETGGHGKVEVRRLESGERAREDAINVRIGGEEYSIAVR